MLRKAHLDLISRHTLRHGIRGGAGLVSIALTLLLGLFLAQCAIAPLEMVEDQFNREAARHNIADAERSVVTDKVNQSVVEVAAKAIDWAVDPSADQLHYLTVEKPAMVSAVIVLLFLAAPFFACLGGFNQTSGDIATKGLRFLLIRTERPNIFLGRFIGTLLFAAFVNLLLFLILAIYMAAKIKVHPSGDMFMWCLQGYARMMMYTLPYLALCAWISSAIDSPFGSLAVSLLLVYFIPLLIGQGANVEAAIGYGQYLTPWGWKYWLLEPIGPRLLGGVAAMLGFTGLFLFAGMRSFGSRDL